MLFIKYTLVIQMYKIIHTTMRDHYKLLKKFIVEIIGMWNEQK